MQFKIFSSYSTSSVGFDKLGQKVIVKNKIQKRVNDVLFDLNNAFNEYKVSGGDKEGIFEIIGQTGHLDMFARIYGILKKTDDESLLHINASSVLLNGQKGEYVSVELSCEIQKLPALEILLTKN